MAASDGHIDRELRHHEELYSGPAQALFDQAAVRAFREHLAAHILRRTGAHARSCVLSLGCGIGDTELLLARSVGEVTGVDLSPAGIREARRRAAAAGVANVRFLEGDYARLEAGSRRFDVVIAVFFLHHLPDEPLAQFPELLRRLLAPGGRFWSLDPSRYRLTGAAGRVLVPSLMRKYQTPGERELAPGRAARIFRAAGYRCQARHYDFLSTPLAGLFPAARAAYRAARSADDILVRTPLLRLLASNFELLAEA